MIYKYIASSLEKLFRFIGYLINQSVSRMSLDFLFFFNTWFFKNINQSQLFIVNVWHRSWCHLTMGRKVRQVWSSQLGRKVRQVWSSQLGP